MKCELCGIDFESKRTDAKYCSPKCRKEAFFKRSIEPAKRSDGTDNIEIEERLIQPEVDFNFTVSYNRQPSDPGYDSDVEAKRKQVRSAKYWYDVPLAAIPVIQKGWPDRPGWMNGRQYFLWWKNEFKVNEDPDKGEPGTPVILNPFPTVEVRYEMAGEGSRRWGA